MPKILAFLSGGLDSLCMINKLLLENSDNDLHIHHVKIQNEENRAKAESVAVANIITYFRSNNYPKFVYSESGIEVPTYNGSFLYDTDSINLFAGFIVTTNKGIKQIAIGANKEDWERIGSTRYVRGTAILRAFCDVEKIYPIKDLTKAEVCANIPITLRELSWSCRRPIYDNNMALPCGKCTTCLSLQKIGYLHKSMNLN